jgi:putative membrane protein
MMWWDDGPWGVGGWFVMSLMMVVFGGGLIVAMVWLIQAVTTDKNPGQPLASPAARADEILAERYARGEIDEDDFTRRRAVLHPSGSGRS